jgi:hypothetical protein
MDHLITYKEATGFIKNPPSLAPRLDLAKIRALCKHYVTGLKQLICPQSLIHGWAGLVMDPVMYASLELTMPFVALVDPGEYAQYPNFATKAAMKMTDKIFERNKNYYLSFVNINRVCFRMLNDNIANQFKVSNTANMTGWNLSMTICSILEQLENSYGKPTLCHCFTLIPYSAAHSRPPKPLKCSSTKSSNARRSRRLPRTHTRQSKSLATPSTSSCSQAYSR